MNQPFGYILLETAVEDNRISDLKVIEKPNLCYVRFATTLQSLDCRNRNGRVYNGDALEKGLSDPNLVELMNNNKWKGERDHPITKDVQRIATISSKECSHRITKWWRDKNLIKGIIETLDDGMYGTALTRGILQGENPSFSLRALAMLDKRGNTTYVDKPPRVITYDEVNLPSHKEAYAEEKKTKILSNGDTTVTYENTDICKNGVIAIEATDIRDMIVNKSDNLKIVCESFDIDPASFKLTNGGKSLSVYKKNEGTIVFGLEQQLARNTIDFWNRFR